MLPDQLSYYGCNPIEIPKNDPYFSKFDMGCISYIRSQPIFPNDCKLGPAEIVCLKIILYLFYHTAEGTFFFHRQIQYHK